MSVAPHIFRQYDIRGVVDRDLDVHAAENVGRAYAASALATGAESIVVGRDNRPSSPMLSDALVRGVTASGLDVIDIGTVPTPVVYWAERILEVGGAIQITGSHNPSEWNGIKMTLGGRSLYGDAIQELARRIASGDFEEGSGTREYRPLLADYVSDLALRFDIRRPVRVVVDCGNGSASLAAGALLREIGADVTTLYCESDGTFPNHHPDPTVDEYLEDLVAEVKRVGAECGIAFDGDGDRIGVVDEHGSVVRGDLLLLLFGLDILERRGAGQKLIFDVKCSQVLPEVFEAAGGVPIMWRTGHSLIKEKMREEDAPLAGELSGHICFADDYYGFDDALYDACRLVSLLANSERPLSAMVGDFPRYHSTPEIRIEVEESEKFDIVERATRHFEATHDVIDVDGARISFDGGWALLRASNTQPVLVARFEAETEAELEAIRGTLETWLAEEGVRV